MRVKSMTKEEALFSQEYAYIFNWKQRIEAVSGLPCPHLSQLSKIFNANELRKACEEDLIYFNGLIEDLRDLTEKF